MRIAYVYDGYYPSTGADALQVLNTVTAMSRQGAHVTLVYPHEPGGPVLSRDELLDHYDVQGDIETVQLQSSNLGGRHLKKLTHSVAAMKLSVVAQADVVYSRNLPVILAALRAGHRVVYDTYRPWPQQIRYSGRFFRKLFGHRRLLGGFFHSHHARNAYLDIGIEARKLCVAHNGFHPAAFESDQTASEARQEIGLQRDVFTIGYTGRLDKEKGIMTLLELAQAMPDINVLLVGGGQDVDVIEHARALGNVFHYDWQKPAVVPTFLRACDVLMIPPSAVALTAGNTVLPMKLFDYLASGRAIVAPHSPDTAELLVHEKNAWLVEKDTLANLVEQIEGLRANRALLKHITHGALATSETLTWDARGRKLLANMDAWLQHAKANS